MGIEPPPPPIDLDEFVRRWHAGARTFEEMNPEFMAWVHRQRRRVFVGYVAMAAYAVIVFLACLFAWWESRP